MTLRRDLLPATELHAAVGRFAQSAGGSGEVVVSLTGPELAWALERLGLPAGAVQMRLVYQNG